jgi:hypothetical protein
MLVSVLGGVSASTADDCLQRYTGSDGLIHYRNICTGGSPGEPGASGGGSAQPSCYLGRKEKLSYQVGFCRGELSCYQYIPSPLSPTEPAPAGTPPTAVYVDEACFTQPPAEDLVSNVHFWQDAPPVDPAAFIDEAIGNLALPAYTLGVNPPRQAVVGLPTWFWAQGAGAGQITGTSAGGLVGTATPAYMEVDPGDGSGTFRCPWTVTPGAACSYEYARSSVHGTARSASGDPAYAVRTRLVLDLTFQFNGAGIELPAAPPTVSTAWQDTAVPVAEVQSLVVPGTR